LIELDLASDQCPYMLDLCVHVYGAATPRSDSGPRQGLGEYALAGVQSNDSKERKMARKNADGKSAEVKSAGEKSAEVEVGEAKSAPKGRGRKRAADAAAAVAVQPGEAAPDKKMSAKAYAREMKKLHVELVTLQQWVVHKGLKVCIVFEGRDGAGKGGTIKAITERVSPRVFRVLALPAPTEREKSQMYAQRYLPHFPAAGEVVIFDRSWYNRAGVERVMGFCSEEQARDFLDVVPLFERMMTNSGIILLKYWLEVSPEEQTRRLKARIGDGRKTWKLSPMDLKSYDRWDDYTKARDEMFAATDTAWAPWFVARSEDKQRVRLNVISHILKHVPYEAAPAVKVELHKRKIGKYKAADYPFRYVPELF
jgi:polyphosphate kinase 2